LFVRLLAEARKTLNLLCGINTGGGKERWTGKKARWSKTRQLPMGCDRDGFKQKGVPFGLTGRSKAQEKRKTSSVKTAGQAKRRRSRGHRTQPPP